MLIEDLTPLQEQIMETLVARWRLGESNWPIRRCSANTRALTCLSEWGFLHYQGGNTEGVWKVFISELGIKEFTDSSYTFG